MRVHKYNLDQPINNIMLPVGSSVVKIDQQSDEIKMWVLEPNTKDRDVRTFQVYATGQEVPEFLDHIGSALLQNGTFVFHVFEDRLVVK